MKTKHTGPSKANGTPARPAKATPDMAKSPSQPHELSDKDRAKLKEFLNKSDKPFSVTTVPLNRKRKRTSANLQTQTDLFDDRLSVRYEIKPANNWESLRRYKKFTVGEESIAVGECILVKHDEIEDPKIDFAAQWKGKVLEVRALDSEHVYVRVAWLNQPEDLDTGRKAYHGRNELIPTNQIDIIDAMTVNGKLPVYHWNEEDDESEMPDPEEFFWRQTFDFANTKTSSKLRLICRDQTPQNPDEMILQCSNKDCRKWMHVKCIAEDAAERAKEAQEPSAKKRKSAGTAKRKSKGGKDSDISPSGSAFVQNDAVTAEVFIADAPPDKPAEKTEIVIIDAEGAQQREEVCCLTCGQAVD